jgi:hypothetical protein
MKTFTVATLLAASATAFAAQVPATTHPIPSLVEKDGPYALMVDGTPYLMLGAQSGNSSMPTLSSALVLPHSLLAKEATDVLREHSTDLLFNHSMRVYLFAAEQGREQKLRFDPELLYVARLFTTLVLKGGAGPYSYPSAGGSAASLCSPFELERSSVRMVSALSSTTSCWMTCSMLLPVPVETLMVRSYSCVVSSPCTNT